ncbi:unnamed protein product [Moneuplotes crassus]|uniref:Uncharacterized protein n=1 Tax=Euplotes crassus TaxID=5936 RepID=A0AAD1XG26_EUPCR|nr:unnamed protein product [Moneuplotes crassus]
MRTDQIKANRLAKKSIGAFARENRVGNPKFRRHEKSCDGARQQKAEWIFDKDKLSFDAPMYLDMTKTGFLQEFDHETQEIFDWFSEENRYRRPQLTEIHNRIKGGMMGLKNRDIQN